MTSNFALCRLFLRFSSVPRFAHSRSSVSLLLPKYGHFLLPFHCPNRQLSSGTDQATNWSQIDEDGLHNLMEAHVEWKREADAELLKRSQNSKLGTIRSLHDFLINWPNEPSCQFFTEDARAVYDRILDHFEKRMTEEMKKTETIYSKMKTNAKKNTQQFANELDTFKKLYIRVLFCFFREFYRKGAEEMKRTGEKGISRQRAEKAQVDKLNEVFDIVPEITKMKRHCFLGALWLSDGQSFRFLDYLNTTVGCSILDGIHINYICHIAIATKEPTILEPLIDLNTFLPPNFLHLAKVLNSLALIYGKIQNFEKLEELWKKMNSMKKKVSYAEKSSQMKPILARIEHFYRTANRKVPGSLLAELKRQSGQPYFISAHAKKREGTTTDARQMENDEEREYL